MAKTPPASLRTPQGGFSCRFAAIHLLLSPAGQRPRGAAFTRKARLGATGDTCATEHVRALGPLIGSNPRERADVGSAARRPPFGAQPPLAAALSAEIGPYGELSVPHQARRARWTLPSCDTRPWNGSGCWGARVCRFRAPELNGPHPRLIRGIAKGYSPLPAFFWVLFLAEQEKYKHSPGHLRAGWRALKRAPTWRFPKRNGIRRALWPLHRGSTRSARFLSLRNGPAESG